MSEPTTMGEWHKWRDEQRRRPRIMTISEYMVWSRTGDAISDHTSASAFPGGLTIDFSAPPIIGLFKDE